MSSKEWKSIGNSMGETTSMVKIHKRQTKRVKTSESSEVSKYPQDVYSSPKLTSHIDLSTDSAEGDKEQGEEIKLKKNRESAWRSRRKKKQQVMETTTEFEELKAKNIKIQKNVSRNF